MTSFRYPTRTGAWIERITYALVMVLVVLFIYFGLTGCYGVRDIVREHREVKELKAENARLRREKCHADHP